MTLLMRDQENQEIGEEKGRKEGRKEGKKEERRRIIFKMLKQGLSEEQIILFCDATEDEIREFTNSEE